MKTLDHSLERIYAQLCYGNCGMAIAELETYLAAWPDGQTTEALRVIKEEYSLMADYWRKGVVDEQRQQLYQRLLQQVYQLFANIAVVVSDGLVSGCPPAVVRPVVVGHSW